MGPAQWQAQRSEINAINVCEACGLCRQSMTSHTLVDNRNEADNSCTVHVTRPRALRGIFRSLLPVDSEIPSQVHLCRRHSFSHILLDSALISTPVLVSRKGKTLTACLLKNAHQILSLHHNPFRIGPSSRPYAVPSESSPGANSRMSLVNQIGPMLFWTLSCPCRGGQT